MSHNFPTNFTPTTQSIHMKNTVCITIAILSTIGISLGMIVSIVMIPSRAQEKISLANPTTAVNNTENSHNDYGIKPKQMPELLATTEKNLTLRTLFSTSCPNIIQLMANAGFPTNDLQENIPDGDLRRGVEVDSHHKKLYLEDNLCFWYFGYHNYLSMEIISFDSQPYFTDFHYITVQKIPAPHKYTTRSLIRYEIKGYTAYIGKAYDQINDIKLCYITVQPYLYITSTSNNCLKVKKLVTAFLP